MVKVLFVKMRSYKNKTLFKLELKGKLLKVVPKTNLLNMKKLLDVLL